MSCLTLTLILKILELKYMLIKREYDSVEMFEVNVSEIEDTLPIRSNLTSAFVDI
jgi:hypothetical protein